MSLLFSSGTPEPFTLVAAKVILNLSDVAGDELLKGHKAAEAFDEKRRAAQQKADQG
jgi:hypothetical protein